MPLLLYERADAPEGGTKYTQLKDISLAGTTTGLIYPFVRAYAPAAPPFAWHATVRDLLDEAGIPSKRRTVVADLRPLLEGNLALYELTDVLGYSYAEWTPIALRMETLVVDHTVPDPPRFKLRFRHRGGRGTPVHQFLYLQGGLSGGSWKWGPVGSVNGALLWPDALAFFLERLAARGEQQDSADRA